MIGRQRSRARPSSLRCGRRWERATRAGARPPDGRYAAAGSQGASGRERTATTAAGQADMAAGPADMGRGVCTDGSSG